MRTAMGWSPYNCILPSVAVTRGPHRTERHSTYKLLPSIENRSPATNAAGTIEHPRGASRKGMCIGRFPQIAPSMPLTRAASIGPHSKFEPNNCCHAFPGYARANWIAKRPGGNSEPDTCRDRVQNKAWFVHNRVWEFAVAASLI